MKLYKCYALEYKPKEAHWALAHMQRAQWKSSCYQSLGFATLMVTLSACSGHNIWCLYPKQLQPCYLKPCIMQMDG